MDCPHIPELSCDEFSESLLKRIPGKRVPISGSLELTFRCNLRCQHCYVSHGHNGIPRQQELNTSEIQRIIDEVVDAGCLWFLITGGEPLVRRDFLDIYTYAKRKGLIITLFTNGTLITPRIADYLAEWTVFEWKSLCTVLLRRHTSLSPESRVHTRAVCAELIYFWSAGCL